MSRPENHGYSETSHRLARELAEKAAANLRQSGKHVVQDFNGNYRVSKTSDTAMVHSSLVMNVHEDLQHLVAPSLPGMLDDKFVPILTARSVIKYSQRFRKPLLQGSFAVFTGTSAGMWFLEVGTFVSNYAYETAGKLFFTLIFSVVAVGPLAKLSKKPIPEIYEGDVMKTNFDAFKIWLKKRHKLMIDFKASRLNYPNWDEFLGNVPHIWAHSQRRTAT